MKKISAFFCVMIFLAGMAYLDSPHSFLNKNFNTMYSYPYIPETVDPSEPVNASSETESDVLPSSDVSLEMILEETNRVDGYEVETYREYEIYKDEKGNIIKKVPTSNYNYLKYRDE